MARDLTLKEIIEWIQSANQEEVVTISHLCIEQLVMMANAKQDLMMGVVGILSSSEYSDSEQSESTLPEQN